MSSTYSVFAKLIRAGLVGVNAHTLSVALDRIDRLDIMLERLNDQQSALTMLQYAGYPESVRELNLFLNVGQLLTPASFRGDGLTGQHAVAYVSWLPPFLANPEPHIQKNASILLQWLATTHQAAIAEQQACLDGLRQMANDEQHISRKQAAYIAYTLGRCGSASDYETIIRMAEYGIEHGRENVALVSEAIYSLNPAGLVNALVYFLNSTEDRQFMTGLHVLEQVAAIDRPDFWKAYYDEMDGIVERLRTLINQHRGLERILDTIEKHLSVAE